MVDEEATFKEFGYYSKDLKLQSNKKVITICEKCGLVKSTKKQDSNKSKICKNCRCLSLGGYNKGVPMSEEQKRKLSKTMTGKKQSPELIEKRIAPLRGRKRSLEESVKLTKGQLQSYKNGRKISHGKGFWYTRTDYTKVWLRSTWEVAYAKYLDSRNILWEYELGPFPITYTYEGQVKEGTYRPDFYLPKEDTYIEIKGWWRDDALPKFEAFREQYSNTRIEVLDRYKLKILGII
jgi:hypothetical protein